MTDFSNDLLGHLGKGSYAILFILNSAQTLQIGKLGKYLFPKGYYIYVGSALGSGGLKSRIRHHLKVSPNPHWHVDYFRRKAVPLEVWVSEQTRKQEHDWAFALNQLKDTNFPAPGFGSSDCNCPTHLFHFKQFPLFKSLSRLLDHSDRDLVQRLKIP